VDLREGVVGKAPGRVALSSPPVIYRHLVITGAHSQESPSSGPAGDLRAWDLRTGKLVWQFHTIPRPGEKNHDAWQNDQWVDRAGANTWGLMTVDEERGIVFAPTGTPPTDFYGADRLGSNLYGSSLLALDAMTGTLKWYFQTTHHDNWDYDLQAPPALIDVTRNGQTVPAVAQYSKQGLLFIFNRITGEPIYGVEERPVVSDNPLPGDVYWPTQPFPLKPAPLARMTFSPADVATVTPEHEKYCRGLLDLEGGVMAGGPYAQYGPRLRVIFPGWTGGGNWNGGAFFPDLGYYLIPSQDLGMLNKMVQSPTNPNMYVRRGPDNAPPGLGTNFWDGQKGWPCQQPPWGELIAVNVNTGDVAWRTRLGSFEELDQKGVPSTGTPLRGGPIVTASGLVFIAASQDAKFRAFDVRSGRVLWTGELSENGRTVPITYEGRSGRQYVAILAGGGNPVARKVDTTQIGGRLHVYALPEGTDAGPVARRIGAPRLLTTTTSLVMARGATAARVGAPRVAAGGSATAFRPSAGEATTGGNASNALPDGPERDLVGRVCSDCHDLGDAVSVRQSKARWQLLVTDMVSRGAQASDDEVAQIVDYLARSFGLPR
jgi:quinoprotein glucose dehydrogenase